MEMKIDMGIAKPQDFKYTKFYVADAAESEQVQKAMFELGFVWCFHKTGEKRVVFINKYGMQAGHWLYVDKDCRIFWSETEVISNPQLGTPRACFQSALFSAANDFHASKRMERKERRRRKMEKKGWIYNTGVKPKISEQDSPFVEIELVCGKRYKHNHTHADWDWSIRDTGSDICRYRLNKPILKLRTISLEEMLKDVVESAGGVVTEENIVIDTNPKKQFGDNAIPLGMWPSLAASYGALGLYNGKLKYGRDNFNATPVEASIYIDGALRHISAWAEGEEFDPADGVPNLGAALANIAILIESRANGMLIDNRKLGSGYLKEREALKKIVESLQILHADKNPRHYTITDR